MIILGIDPGYAIVGWGVLEYNANKFKVIDYGAITTDAKPLSASPYGYLQRHEQNLFRLSPAGYEYGKAFL